MPSLSFLLPGEEIIDDGNYKSLIGDGEKVFAGGEMRLLARELPPEGYSHAGYSTAFDASNIPLIPRNEWDARLEEQKAKRARVSDHCNYPALDQNGLPWCWGFGVTGAAITKRLCMGLPLQIISAASVCGPVVNYRETGYYEGPALKYFHDHGGVNVKLWPELSRDRSLASRPEVIADRANYKAPEYIDLGSSFDRYATMALLGHPSPFAYNWMRHVMYVCDLVKIEAGAYGLRVRNSWSDKDGAKNDLGFGGFRTYREGRGTPSSGLSIYQMTASMG
jgi:hypothetical protein